MSAGSDRGSVGMCSVRLHDSIEESKRCLKKTNACTAVLIMYAPASSTWGIFEACIFYMRDVMSQIKTMPFSLLMADISFLLSQMLMKMFALSEFCRSLLFLLVGEVILAHPSLACLWWF